MNWLMQTTESNCTDRKLETYAVSRSNRNAEVVSTAGQKLSPFDELFGMQKLVKPEIEVTKQALFYAAVWAKK